MENTGSLPKAFSTTGPARDGRSLNTRRSLGGLRPGDGLMRFIRSGKASSATKSCGCGHMMEEETGGEEVLADPPLLGAPLSVQECFALQGTGL